jgi:acylphosphatase
MMTGEAEGAGRRGYRVVGLVQGVGFRWWTRHTAERLGLGGSVRNAADGSVEVHVVGPRAELEALERALRSGPPRARVDRLEPISPRADMPRTEFRILY